jgi:hypothetical protein
MARVVEPDLFEAEAQPDLFGTEAAPAYRPDPDKVRSRLHKILAERGPRKRTRGSQRECRSIVPLCRS